MAKEIKTAKSIVFDFETLVIVQRYMGERNLNFSKASNFLIKQGAYLIEKIQLERKRQQSE